MKKLTTLEMEIAMMQGIGIRANLVVPNVSWSFFARQEVDILYLTRNNYATEIEIKVTKADLKKDGSKRHNHKNGMIARSYFAVPDKLEQDALKLIPEHCGLYTVTRVEYVDFYTDQVTTRNRVKLVRGAKRNKGAKQWTESQRGELARLGALRILGLKKTIQTLKSKS